MIEERARSRDEIEDVWGLDRSEVIDCIYYYEDDALVLKPEHYDMRGWLPGMPERAALQLEDCYDRGGWFHGLFDDGQLVGVAVLESKFMGRNGDQLHLTFMPVGSAYRDQGLGRRLFESARAAARERGAKSLYISATPSEHTVNFYLGRGCRVTAEPDPELFALEPEDIHLVCDVG